MTPELTNRFIDDVLSLLRGTYTLANGTTVQGQAVSFVLSEMRDYGKRWRGLGSLGDFEYLLEQHGFRIVKGQNSRGNHARVVTV
jgi:hypothetical protein